MLTGGLLWLMCFKCDGERTTAGRRTLCLCGLARAGRVCVEAGSLRGVGGTEGGGGWYVQSLQCVGSGEVAPCHALKRCHYG